MTNEVVHYNQESITYTNQGITKQKKKKSRRKMLYIVNGGNPL